MKVNRLDPEYLREWRQNYNRVFADFAAGNVTLTLFEAIDCLRHLGFKDEALKIEVLELQKSKRAAQGPALKIVS